MLPLRPNVCILLINNKGQLLLGERHGEPGVWQFPQGGVEPGDTLEATVLREVWEELGLKPDKVKILFQLKATHDYEWNTPPKYAQGRWRGQSQTFWLLEFLGKDQDIQLDLAEPEFKAWKWCSRSDISQVAEPKRVPGYLQALKELECSEHSLLKNSLSS